MKSAGNHFSQYGAVAVVPHRRERHDAGVEPGIADVAICCLPFRRNPCTVILTRSIHGRCGGWPSNLSQPSTARSFSSSRLPMTSNCAARVAHPDRQGQTPEAFLRDHPVAHVLEPIQFAGLAVDRFGQERDLLDDAHDLVAPFHVDEPLVDQAEKQLRLAAPAVRIAVRIAFRRRKGRAFPVRLARMQSVVAGSTADLPSSGPKPVDEDAVLIERGDRRQTLILAEEKVFLAAAGGDVDDAGALRLADVLPGDRRDAAPRPNRPVAHSGS